MAAAVCRHLEASCVAVMDTHNAKLQRALDLGATHAVNIDNESIEEAMTAMGIYEGFDICLEMSGNPDAYPIAFTHTKLQGKIALLGIPETPQATDWRAVIFKQLTVKGVQGRKMPETRQRMGDLIKEGLNNHNPDSNCYNM